MIFYHPDHPVGVIFTFHAVLMHFMMFYSYR